jgi:hypothetical protein
MVHQPKQRKTQRIKLAQKVKGKKLCRVARPETLRFTIQSDRAWNKKVFGLGYEMPRFSTFC